MRLNEHAHGINLGNAAITSTNKHVAVLEKGQHVDTLLEKTFGGSDSLVELAGKVDLDDVTSEGSEVSGAVIRADYNALVLSLNLTGVDVVESNLLGDEITGPNSDTVVVNGDEFVVGVVEEFNLVGDVHADLVSANSLAGLNLFKLRQS